MTRLTSKIQYKNFEIGEFIEEKERTFEEIMELIERFPWELQREKIVIDLTNPSVTIQGKNNDYLKIALFYNGKFVLRYFDQQQTLYTKSISEVTDSYKYIRDYIATSVFDTTDFKKENTLFQDNAKHFISQKFNYEVTPSSACKFLLSTSGINLIFTVIVIAFFSFNHAIEISVLSASIVLLLIFFIGGGLNLILFFQYYLYTNGKILIMSKGNEIFYFGNKENPTKYNKTEITQFTISRIRNSKHTLSNFAVVKIELTNGFELEIPNILVDYLALESKLFEIAKIENSSYPSLRT